jgi:hypothetical protein
MGNVADLVHGFLNVYLNKGICVVVFVHLCGCIWIRVFVCIVFYLSVIQGGMCLKVVISIVIDVVREHVEWIRFLFIAHNCCNFFITLPYAVCIIIVYWWGCIWFNWLVVVWIVDFVWGHTAIKYSDFVVWFLFVICNWFNQYYTYEFFVFISVAICNKCVWQPKLIGMFIMLGGYKLTDMLLMGN